MQAAIEYQDRNKEIIEAFVKTLPSLSARRFYKYRIRLGKISRDFGKPFDKVSIDDLRAYVDKVNESPDYTDSTKADYRNFLKKFFGWLNGRESVSWIRLGTVKATVGVDDILTDAELEMMRSACENLRDKALIETAYETAFRPHELLSLEKSSIAFDEYGATVYIEKGKTGARRVRVVNAAPLLAEWIANHPLKERSAALWIDLSANSRYRPLGWVGLSRLIRRIAKRAGIGKRVNPYIFRHTRLTFLAQVLTEAQLCEFAGWEIGSDMPRKYVHLSGRDVDEALLRAYGLTKPKEAIEFKSPKKCARCGTLNPHNMELCQKCGLALSAEAAIRRDEELENLKARLEVLERAIAESLDGRVTISRG
jgi:integrase/recombinase XerD